MQDVASSIRDVPSRAQAYALSVADYRYYNSQGYDDYSLNILLVSKSHLKLNNRNGWAYPYIDCARRLIVGADIYINQDANWSYGDSIPKMQLGAYTAGGKRSFNNVLVHELLHAFGLGHVSSNFSIMGSDTKFYYTNGSTARTFVGSDSTAGLIQLYRRCCSTTKDDVSVTHWLYDETSSSGNEYAQTRYARVWDHSSGTRRDAPSRSRGSLTGTNELVFDITREREYSYHFTFEYDGSNGSHKPTVMFVLSKDDEITSSDTFLSFDNQLTLFRSPRILSAKITLPKNTPTGIHRLGVIVNPYWASDRNSVNNASYIPIYVK